ncbi:MAG TPA: YeeE/YedE thiosulfate transporter family protein [Bryobacteraceae bacterium]|nr:YeeE/YedE thiosulfate transporter family protein [Bryobacteraceae bacterium]HPT25462.1 YeeE/YedE thiosulfate transporter family protein [Bryobacteraceae bacterium]
MNLLSKNRWSPYLAGALLGVLSWFAFLTAGVPLGVSSTFVRTAGMIESTVAPDHVRDNAYFAATKVKLDWEWMIAAGILIGAYLSSKLSKEPKGDEVPQLWASRFGPSRGRRMLGAFLGGLVLIFGARLAGGCTSGHGLSGSMQLAVSGWAFFACIFASGVATATLLYRGGKS